MDWLTEFKPDTVGAFVGVPADVYHRAPGVSNSTLKIIARSPLDYYRAVTGQVATDSTDAQEYGNLFHSAILENRTVNELVHIEPSYYGPEGKPWNNNATECKKWHEQHADKPVLKGGEISRFDTEVKYVKNHPRFVRLVLGGMVEVSLFARSNVGGMLLKGRLDVMIGNKLIVDVKTTLDASSEGFSREILKRGYHVQAAMYCGLVHKLTGEMPQFAFLAVEKGSMIKVNSWYLSTEAIDLGQNILNRRLETLYQCRIGNRWPEWNDSETDGPGYIDLPDFVYEKQELTGLTETKQENGSQEI